MTENEEINSLNQTKKRTGETFDRIGTAAAVEEIGGDDDGAGDILNRVAETGAFNDDSPLKWLLPLVVLAALIILGWAFCGGAKPVA